jgi:hypothetical protein
MAIETRRCFTILLLCLFMELCFTDAGIAGQSAKEASMKTVESVPPKTMATVTDLKTIVPIDEFYKRVPALRELDRRAAEMNFFPSSGPDSTIAKEIHFENAKGESGIIRIFTKIYTQMQTSFDLEIYRIQIDSNKRYVLWTVAVQPIGAADNLAVMFNEKDPIEPSHGVRNPETAAGCFDASVTHCPPNPTGSTPSGPSGASDTLWDKCFREIAYEISKCVAWEGFTESCASDVASAIGAWCQ